MVPQEKSDIARCKLAVPLEVSLEQVLLNGCDKGYVKVGNLRPSKNKFGYACLLAPAALPRIQGSPPHTY